MKLYRLYSILCCALLAPSLSLAHYEVPPLFSSRTVLELTMAVDFDELCRPRESEDCGYTASVLNYPDDAGNMQSIPIEIRIRGGWRSLRENCNVPPLFVRFSESDTAGTPFEGVTTLPLTTHCRSGLQAVWYSSSSMRPDYEQYLLKEYLGYRLYNLLTDLSLRIRLAQISYYDPDKSDKPRARYAFFTEHFKSAAARNGARLLPRESFDHEVLDTRSAELIALYEFMIGNLDWSIVRQRNLILLEMPGGKHVPVPYDLDMSGLVNAHYAGPPLSLPVDTVRKRYYLGFCHPDSDWEALFSRFHAKQTKLLSLTEGVPGLDKRNRRNSTKYLEQFFRILASEERRTKIIIDACKPWPPGPDDHMSRDAK